VPQLAAAAIATIAPMTTTPNQPACGQPPRRAKRPPHPKSVTHSPPPPRPKFNAAPSNFRDLLVNYPATIYRRFRYSERPITLLTGLGVDEEVTGTYLPHAQSGY
jgi:hypothetical protein